MKKQVKTDAPKQENLLGENTVLTLTLPWEDVKKAYDSVLHHEAEKVTLKGFRQGKAPLALAEAALGHEKLMEHALSHVLPQVYEQEVAKAKITPLVKPEISLKSGEEGKPFVCEAATAVAPEVILGDYQKLIADGKAKYQKKLDEQKDAKFNDDELLQTIFVTLIEAIKPKIAPLLLQEEMGQQARQLVGELERRNSNLEEYIKSQGKTEEEFRNDLAALSLGALQLEFVLQEITRDLGLSMGDEDIKAWMKTQGYPEDTNLPHDLRERLSVSLLRRKTTDEILKRAKNA